jgi:type I restriction enzyme, R subunit
VRIDYRDPDPRSRDVFAFHRPETLRAWASEPSSLRTRLRQMPLLITNGMRQCQIEAIHNFEASFAENHPRALIQMATGAGKTFTAVSFIYRLIKHAGARRVLFLVDRSNPGRQTGKRPEIRWRLAIVRYDSDPSWPEHGEHGPRRTE